MPHFLDICPEKVLTPVKIESQAGDACHTVPRGARMSVFELSGRKALVTGGAQGLGEGMAKALADAGARVMAADIQDASAVAKGLGEGHAATTPDVTSEHACEAAIGHTVEALGGVDLVVNNAGIEITSLLTEVVADDVRRMLEVNILGTTSGSSTASARCGRVARPGRAARSSTSPRSPRP